MICSSVKKRTVFLRFRCEFSRRPMHPPPKKEFLPPETMLNDKKFRRTARCGHYAKLLAQKEPLMKVFPVKVVRGEDFTASWLHQYGLDEPILVAEDESGSNRLGLRLPSRDSTLQDVARIVGPTYPVKLMEVGSQTQLEGEQLGDYADYLAGYTSGTHKVLNMITLECSATPLSSHIQPPTVVRQVDWIDTAWPIERRARGDYPAVQRYCLSGMAGSYTDFHVDFGGTSVWYHVLSGRKRFYLVPPSCANLAAYARWTTDSTAEEVFFGDYVQAIHDQAVKAAHKAGDNEAKSQPQVFRLDLLPGQTLFIPGAWIHAVFTPEDSLVFGGNFLHSAAVLRQLQVHQIEQRTRVGKQYRFPYFKELHAYVLCRLLPVMRRAAQRPQQELAAWMEDESDEDLASMAAALLSHDTLLRQFPYLVRACEVWASPDASGKAAAAEAALLAKVAKECIAEYDDDGSNFDSLASIIAEWWRLLEELASARDASGATQSGSLSSFTLHVRRIRAACPERMDFLDSAFLRGGLSYQGKSLQSWPDPSLDAAVLGNWDQFGQPLSAMPTSSPSAALKLRLGRGSPAAIVETDQRNWVCCDQCGKWRSLPATVDVQGLPEQWTCAMNVDRSRNTCDADEESDAQQQQRLLEQPVVQWVQCSQCEKWRTVAPTVDAAALPDDWRCANNDWDLTYSVCEAPEEAVPNASTGTATTPIADQPPLKLSLKRKAPQSPDDAAAAEAETGSARKRKIHLTFAVKTKRKAAEDNDPHLYTKTYESRVVNAADSRTRGRKLSAKFLQDSADAEVSADEEEDDGLLEGAWKLPAENVDPVMFARMKAAAVRQGVALDTLVPGTILTKEGEIMAAAKPRARPSKPAVRFDDSEDDVDYQDEAMADGAVAEEGPAVTEADFEMSDDSSDVNEDSGDEDYGLEEVSDDGLEVLDVQEEAKGTDRSRTRAKIPKGARADKEAEKGPKTAWSVPKFAPGQSVSSNIGSSSSSGDMPSLAALVGRSAAAAATSGPRAPPAPAATAPLMYAGAPVQAAPRQMQSSSLSLAQRKPVPTKKFPSREALLKKIGMRR